MILVACAVTCAGPGNYDEQGTSEMTRDTLDAARQALTDSVIDLPGVAGVGVGECNGRPCLKVFIERRSEELEAHIPRSMDGVPVEIEVTGEIRPLEPE